MITIRNYSMSAHSVKLEKYLKRKLEEVYEERKLRRNREARREAIM